MSPQQAPQQQSWSRSQDLDAALVYEVVSTPISSHGCLHLMGACFSLFSPLSPGSAGRHTMHHVGLFESPTSFERWTVILFLFLTAPFTDWKTKSGCDYRFKAHN